MPLSRSPHLVFLAAALCLLVLSMGAGGWFLLLIPIAFLAIAAAVGVPVRLGHSVAFWSMMACTVIGAAALAFFYWAFGAAVDAADAFQPEPPGTQFGGAALIVFAVCFVVAVASGVWSLAPARRR